jgi:hypothetical protein
LISGRGTRVKPSDLRSGFSQGVIDRSEERQTFAVVGIRTVAVAVVCFHPFLTVLVQTVLSPNNDEPFPALRAILSVCNLTVDHFIYLL